MTEHAPHLMNRDAAALHDRTVHACSVTAKHDPANARRSTDVNTAVRAANAMPARALRVSLPDNIVGDAVCLERVMFLELAEGSHVCQLLAHLLKSTPSQAACMHQRMGHGVELTPRQTAEQSLSMPPAVTWSVPSASVFGRSVVLVYSAKFSRPGSCGL